MNMNNDVKKLFSKERILPEFSSKILYLHHPEVFYFIYCTAHCTASAQFLCIFYYSMRTRSDTGCFLACLSTILLDPDLSKRQGP